MTDFAAPASRLAPDTARKRAGAAPVPVSTASPQHPSPHSVRTRHEAPLDAGSGPQNHYRARLPAWRHALRARCLPLVRAETELLAKFQAAARCRVLDAYFAWTANLAAHTFYVLMLPPLFWFGASTTGRDLVFVLGMGVYATGFCKDMLCLPRPRSPPVNRITMLPYTAQEYGWPSSHAANATAVSLVLLARLVQARSEISAARFAALAALLGAYYGSLVVGRLYCGMHGFFDVACGALIGATLFLLRFFGGAAYDAWLLQSSRNDSLAGVCATVALIVAGHALLIHVHPEPVDDCPCFDDSVAFVGVLMGLDLAHYACVLSGFFARRNAGSDPLLIPFDADCSLAMLAARLAVGVALVVTWKLLLKPLVFSLLPPLYKRLGISLSRSHFISSARSGNSARLVRRQSISNMNNEPLADLDHVLRPLTVTMSPETDIDAYELLDYLLHVHRDPGVPVKISGVFRPRYDVEITGRCIIYAGIAVVAVWGMGLSVVWLNLI